VIERYRSISLWAPGGADVLELRLPDTGEMTALQERLLESAEFGDARLALARHLPGGGVVATLRVGAR